MSTIALAACILALTGVATWLVHGRITDVRVAGAATTRAERAEFERDAAKQDAAELQRIVTGLEEVLAAYINTAPNANLARTDVLGRLVRVAAGQAADRAVRPGAEDAVPAPAATERTEGAVLPADPNALMQP